MLKRTYANFLDVFFYLGLCGYLIGLTIFAVLLPPIVIDSAPWPVMHTSIIYSQPQPAISIKEK